MFSYYNPAIPQIQGTQSTKRHKPKGSPLPCFIPVGLYEAIRISCVYMALDENATNPLNAHREPILRSFGGNTVCVYSQDLLKQWLKFLCSDPLWSQTVLVDKETRVKRGHISQTVVTRIRTTCLVVPTDGDIRSVARDNVQLGSELTFIASQLRNCLLRRVGNEELFQPSEVPLGSVPSHTVVTTPVNVVKQDRLHKLGYGKVALKGPDAVAWDSFHRAESMRFKYVFSSALGLTVNDASINSLSNEEAELHNSMMVAAMLESAPDASGYTQHKDYMGKSSKGSAVNPALVAYQRTVASAKITRTDNPDTRAYQDMINEYHRLTGHRLDLKVERAQKSLPYRLHEIESAHIMMASSPYCTMGYNQVTNKMYPIHSDPPPSATVPVSHIYQAKQGTMEKVQIQRQQLYGNPPTQPRIQSSPSDVQRYMSTSSAYVPPVATTQKPARIVPNATVSKPTLSASETRDMFTIPTISKSQDPEYEEGDDAYYPESDDVNQAQDSAPDSSADA